jgi:hypothetical protein
VVRTGRGSAGPRSGALAAAAALCALALASLAGCASRTEGPKVSPPSLGASYAPGQPIALKGTVSGADGTPLANATVGAIVVCSRSREGECEPGEVLCRIDPACAMCSCGRTSDSGGYELAVGAPGIVGGHRVKVVAVCPSSGERGSWEGEFSVGEV